MSKLIDLIGLTNLANDIKKWVNDHFLRKDEAPTGSTPSTTTPKMDGEASVGTENAFARGDHRHPSDTSKVDKELGKGLSTNDYDDKAKAVVDAIPANPQYTDTVYDDTELAGRVSTIEGKESGWDAKQDAINDLNTIRSGAEAGAAAIPMPDGGSVGQVLKKTADGTEWANESGGGGTSDYSSLTNKPQINSVTLSGNKSLSDLGIAAAADIPTVPTKLSEFTDDLGTSPTHSHSQYLTSHQDITGKADKVSSATNGNFAALDSNGNLTDSGHKHSDYLTSHQDISGKADKATTLAGYGITDAKIDNGVITLGSNTITPLTSHQSLSDYVQKSQTAGLLKNDGTVDTSTYLTQHQDLTNYVEKSQTAGLLKNDGTVDTSTYLTQHQSLSGYAKYYLCQDETEYNSISPKDSGTLYLIPES